MAWKRDQGQTPLSPTAWLLPAWILFCAGWLVFARKPWITQVFGVEAVKRLPIREYMSAGLWIGFALSGVTAVLLLFLRTWWNRPDPVPLVTPPRHEEHLPAHWFWGAVSVIMVAAVWQRWPAMSLGFWGDEGWMFWDFVHGKWQATSKGASIQEGMRFNPISWSHAIFGDRNGNNHWLATVLQRACLKVWQALGGHPEWSFRESVVRLPVLAAGVASLAALAGWLRCLGRPVAGLAAVTFMALHPWHVRFSVEARGYSLMLLFFILTLWTLTVALRKGRTRDWLVFGLMQFFVMYSWKGGVYALVAVNLVTAGRLLLGPVPDPRLRLVAVSRWLAAGLLGAMLFFPLAMPSQLQMRDSIEEVRRRAKPMEAEWQHDAVSETLTGIPWHEKDAANPREVSIHRLIRKSPWTVIAVAGLVLVLLLGAMRLWREDRLLATLCVAVLLSGLVAMLHFKYILRVELLTWYLLFNVPVLAVLFGVAVTPPRTALAGHSRNLRAMGWGVAAMTCLGGFAALGAPMIKDHHRYPREQLKRAWKLTRARHEPRGFRQTSNIYTAWLWRNSWCYDPRGDMYVRTKSALEAKMELARRSNGEFYMIVGIRDLSEMLCGEVIRELRNRERFDHLGTLWGVEPLNTLEIYRMRKEPPAPR